MQPVGIRCLQWELGPGQKTGCICGAVVFIVHSYILPIQAHNANPFFSFLDRTINRDVR